MTDPIASKGFSSVFVARPILAVVCNLLIVIAGIAAYMGLDIREMPQVDQPVISVRASFDNAAPDTVDTEVTEILEDGLSAVEGLLAYSSQSSAGTSRITLEFSDGVDIDTAANEAREIISGLARDLPEDVDPTVSKSDSDSDPIMRLALTGDATLAELTDLAEGPVSDRLDLIDGIASVEVAGDQAQEYLVELNMAALIGRGLTVSDVQAALSTLDLAPALGSLESATQDISLKLSGNEVRAQDIARLPIDDHTRIGDVARVQLTAQERSVVARVNGAPSVGVNIVRQSQSNTLAISRDVRDAVAELQQDLPDGIRLIVSADDGVFIDRALNEVMSSIMLAVLIVVLVIFAFLRVWRATLIPALTIPVALTGTLAAIWAAGFSINTISLLALVLATGMVVDDAIVVVENVVRRRQEGLGRRAAAAQGANEVFFAVISTTATLAAVFIPISFLPGQAGGIFAEFGFVLAFCVTVSSVVALTLVPMLAAFLDPGRVAPGSDAASGPGLLGRGCLWLVDRALGHPVLVLGLVAGFAVISAGVYGSLNSALTPAEDRGAVMIAGRAPSGVSVAFTDEQFRQVEEILAPYVATGEVAVVQSLVGLGGGSSGILIVRLADWADRGRSQQQFLAELQPQLNRIAGMTVFARSPNSLGIRGAGNGLTFAVTGDDGDSLVSNSKALVAAMAARPDIFVSPQLSEESYAPEIQVTLNEELAQELGLSLTDITDTIGAMTSGVDAAEVFLNGQETTLTIQPGGRPINDPSDLDRAFARTSDGAFLPLSSVASFDQVPSLSSIDREGGSRAVSIQSNLAADVDLGQAMQAVQDLSREVLGGDGAIVFTGEAETLQSSESGTQAVFAIAFLVVLLVLAAQFESLISAVVIMLTVPFGLGAAVIAIALTGGSLNYYSQIGLVMLIGIMAKNGILIVEFANQLRQRGQDIDSAIREAMRLRLRPVMMTMVSTVLGGAPLVLSLGAGAEARQAVGWVVVGGLGFATVFTLFLTPVLYRILAPFGGEPGHAARQLAREEAALIA